MYQKEKEVIKGYCFTMLILILILSLPPMGQAQEQPSPKDESIIPLGTMANDHKDESIMPQGLTANNLQNESIIPPVPSAHDLSDRQISGRNTVRSEYYHVTGDESASPYRDEGLQTFDEFDFGFTVKKNPFTVCRGQVFGVINDSEYRSRERGFILERVNLFHEKGDTALPYRIEIGDFFGFYSYRTLQRSLKGLQLEFQPWPERKRYSILLISGAGQSSWEEFQPSENYTNGLSFLLENPFLGQLSLNLVQHTRKTDEKEDSLRCNQTVGSLAALKTVQLISQKLTLEGEVSYFTGNPGSWQELESRNDRQDNGLYLQINGQSSLPVSYRVRYEEYGQDYRPQGAVVTPERRSAEGHASWRLVRGLEIRGRVQNFEDGYESPNPIETMTYGLTFSGPLLTGFMRSFSGHLDTFLQEVEDENKSIHYVTHSATLNLNKALPLGWNTRVGFFFQEKENKISGSIDARTGQASLGADHGLGVFGFQGSLSPGVVVRKVDTQDESREFFPTLALSLSKGNHSLDYSGNFNYLDRQQSSIGEVAIFSNNLTYRYTRKEDTFGLELISEQKDQDPGNVTRSYKAGLFWTHAFQKSGKAKMPLPQKPSPVESPAQIGPAVKERVDLAKLVPGSDLSLAKKRLELAGIYAPIEQPNLLIYETRLFEETEQRQRLALVHESGKLTKAALIIDFTDIGRPESLIQTFERVRSLLIEKYGRPANFYEKGEITDDLISQINNGTFIRLTEWSNPGGGIIRFGLPRRLDGIIRMEVQIAESFPQPQDTLWSVEEVR